MTVDLRWGFPLWFAGGGGNGDGGVLILPQFFVLFEDVQSRRVFEDLGLGDFSILNTDRQRTPPGHLVVIILEDERPVRQRLRIHLLLATFHEGQARGLGCFLRLLVLLKYLRFDVHRAIKIVVLKLGNFEFLARRARRIPHTFAVRANHGR